MSDILGVIAAAAWIYLICVRGRFWLAAVRDTVETPLPPRYWPAVAVVIPARNEAELIAVCLQSLLHQEYAGPLSIVVADDNSGDDTAEVAKRAGDANPERPLAVIACKGPPAGWTGKVWALKQGIAAVERTRPEFLLLTDADIEHSPDTVAWLVKQSLVGRYVLTSLMAKLRCESLAERSHVPAFVYFFQMLFPFSWVNRAESNVAAAAGGCMLVRAEALAAVGGIASIRNSLIDDCALAARLKTTGSVWLGLTDRVRSIRPYKRFAEIEQMIARSAYAQLNYSPLLLAAAVAGMAVTFLAPPLLAIFAAGLPRYLGLLAWLAMAVSFLPTLRLYRQSPLWSIALPGIAFLYLSYTIDSAFQHLRQRGGQWKGRVHVNTLSLQ